MDLPRLGLLNKRPPLSDSFASRLDSVFFSKSPSLQLTIVSDSDDESPPAVELQAGLRLLTGLRQRRLTTAWVLILRASPLTPKKPQRVRSPQTLGRTLVLHPRLERRAAEAAAKKLFRVAQPRFTDAWTQLRSHQSLSKTMQPLHWTLDATRAARVYSRLDKLFYRRVVRGFYAVLRLMYRQ